MNAKFVHDGKSINYRPATNISAGSVVVIGDRIGIAKIDIKADELGALAMEGVFDVVKGEDAVARETVFYWDGTQITTNADNGLVGENLVSYVRFGVAVAAAEEDAETVRVRIN